MAIERIDDPADPRLTDYRRLNDQTYRREIEGDRWFVAEGTTAIARLFRSDHVVVSVLVTPAALARLGAAIDGFAGPVLVAERDVLNTVVGFDLHRGAVAAAERRPDPGLDRVLAEHRRVVILEGLNDPENLGAIARSARALGIEGAVIDPRCIDPYYRRSVRVSMGEILLLPTTRSTDWPGDLDRVRAAGFEIWAMSPDPAGDDLWDLDVPARVAVLVGAEGPGLSPARWPQPIGGSAFRSPTVSIRSTSATPPRSHSPPCPTCLVGSVSRTLGDVAQLVAHRLCKAGVAGSSPVVSTPSLEDSLLRGETPPSQQPPAAVQAPRRLASSVL